MSGRCTGFKTKAIYNFLLVFTHENIYYQVTSIIYKFVFDFYVGLGLWCLMPLSTIFQLYRDSQFYWCWKPEKTTDLPQVSDTLSHNVVSCTPCLSGIRTHNVSGDRHWL